MWPSGKKFALHPDLGWLRGRRSIRSSPRVDDQRTAGRRVTKRIIILSNVVDKVHHLRADNTVTAHSKRDLTGGMLERCACILGRVRPVTKYEHGPSLPPLMQSVITDAAGQLASECPSPSTGNMRGEPRRRLMQRMTHSHDVTLRSPSKRVQWSCHAVDPRARTIATNSVPVKVQAASGTAQMREGSRGGSRGDDCVCICRRALLQSQAIAGLARVDAGERVAI